MGLAKNIFSQTRKPEGFLGKMMLGTMNPGHAKLADWGFTHLPEIAPEKAADLGCGGGRNAGELLKKYPKAHVTARLFRPVRGEGKRLQQGHDRGGTVRSPAG